MNFNLLQLTCDFSYIHQSNCENPFTYPSSRLSGVCNTDYPQIASSPDDITLPFLTHTNQHNGFHHQGEDMGTHAHQNKEFFK